MKYMIFCWIICLITLGVVAHLTERDIAAQIQSDKRKQDNIRRGSCEAYSVRPHLDSSSVEDRRKEGCTDER